MWTEKKSFGNLISCLLVFLSSDENIDMIFCLWSTAIHLSSHLPWTSETSETGIKDWDTLLRLVLDNYVGVGDDAQAKPSSEEVNFLIAPSPPTKRS